MRKANFAASVKEKTPHVDAMIWLLLATYRNYKGLCILRIYWTGIRVCGIIICTYYGDSMPVKSIRKPPKLEALREEGTLNPTPDEVNDPKFQENEFFDPNDIVQVKYEMLRRVSVENASVSAATEEYGVSRPTYYQTKASFDKGGVAGLVPQKRGPRGPHKLRGQALAFVQQQLVAGEPVRARELAKLVRQKFGLNIHPRTIERAVAGKKLPDEQRQHQFAESSMVVAQYEALRGAVLGEALPPEARTGLLLFLRRGMCGWARALAAICAPQRPTGSRPPDWTISEEHRAVVHILAAMVINANHYGATP